MKLLPCRFNEYPDTSEVVMYVCVASAYWKLVEPRCPMAVHIAARSAALMLCVWLSVPTVPWTNIAVRSGSGVLIEVERVKRVTPSEGLGNATLGLGTGDGEMEGEAGGEGLLDDEGLSDVEALVDVEGLLDVEKLIDGEGAGVLAGGLVLGLTDVEGESWLGLGVGLPLTGLGLRLTLGLAGLLLPLALLLVGLGVVGLWLA